MSVGGHNTGSLDNLDSVLSPLMAAAEYPATGREGKEREKKRLLYI